MAHPRPRLGVILKIVVAAYFVALAAMPFAHHDLACHLKSNTHCAVCHVGTSADDHSVQPALAPADQTDAGRADEAAFSIVTSLALASSSGRSPPPVAVSLL